MRRISGKMRRILFYYPVHLPPLSPTYFAKMCADKRERYNNNIQKTANVKHTSALYMYPQPETQKNTRGNTYTKKKETLNSRKETLKTH